MVTVERLRNLGRRRLAQLAKVDRPALAFWLFTVEEQQFLLRRGVIPDFEWLEDAALVDEIRNDLAHLDGAVAALQRK